VHRGGGLSRAALFVAEHDDVRGRGSSHIRLHQHAASHRHYSYSGAAHGQWFACIALF
jgi:hypothetical protein